MAKGYYGQQIQSGAADFGGPYLRDYTHASKTFLSNGYALAPKLKFLFHVYFDINTEAYPENLSTGNNFGLVVKTVKLPSYNFAVETLNQYNRKRIIQTKIRYNPVQFTVHDDSSNMMTRLWNAYYTYYYGDGRNFGSLFNGAKGTGQGDPGYNFRNIYQGSITGNVNWGYDANSQSGSPSKIPFFKNITVFGFNQHQFTAYTLINPLIASFNHDTYNYSSGDGTMEMQFDIDYETVAYNEGALDGNSPENIVKGFGSVQNYDRTPSPITAAGTNSLYPGNGGYAPASGGFIRRPPNNNFTRT